MNNATMPAWSPFWHVDPETHAETPAYAAMVVFALLISGGMELLSHLVSEGVEVVLKSDEARKPLPYNPNMHLDELETVDKAFIGCNKALTVVFVYHLAQLVLTADHVKWAPSELTFLNTVGARRGRAVIHRFAHSTARV